MAPLRHLRPTRVICGPFASFVVIPRSFKTCPHLIRPIPRLFTAYPCFFTAFLRLFTAYPCLLWLSHACLRPFCTFYGPSAPAKGSFLPFPPPPSSPRHPAGRTAGSARTRSRVQTLENPFWGAAAVSPHPRPPTPQAASPCSWTCRRLLLPPPQPKRTAAGPPPARGAGLRHPGAKGTGWRPCRPCRPTKAGKSSLGRRAPKSLSNSRARRTQSRP